jgi:hypothetical protein
MPPIQGLGILFFFSTILFYLFFFIYIILFYVFYLILYIFRRDILSSGNTTLYNADYGSTNNV